MLCPHCGQAHPGNAAFCPIAGKALPHPRANRWRGPLLAGFANLGALGLLAICIGMLLMLVENRNLALPTLPSLPGASTAVAVIPLTANTPAPSATPTLNATATTLHIPTAIPTATPTQRPTSTHTPTLPPPTLTATAASCAISVTGRYARLWSQYHDQLGCPYSASQITIPSVAEQPFQSGHLFWRSDTDRYYAIYDGGGATSGGWAVYGNKPGAIQNCADHLPPGGYYKPASGFGDVWCFVGSANSSLGWALAPERGFVGGQGVNAQDFEKGSIFQDSDGVARNLVYVLIGAGFYRVSP